MRKADPELHARRREAIVSAATRCFLEQGFHRTSVGDIAGAAGVSMGLLYRYFANKDAVIGAVAERDTSETLQAIARMGNAPRLDAALRAFVMDQATILAAPDYAALVAEIGAEALRNHAILSLWQGADSRVRAALTDVIAGHSDAVGADKAEVAALAALVLTLVEGLGARAALPDQPSLTAMLHFCTFTPGPNNQG